MAKWRGANISYICPHPKPGGGEELTQLTQLTQTFYWTYQNRYGVKILQITCRIYFQQMHIVPLQVTKIIYLWSSEWSSPVMYSNIKASVLNDYFV